MTERATCSVSSAARVRRPLRSAVVAAPLRRSAACTSRAAVRQAGIAATMKAESIETMAANVTTRRFIVTSSTSAAPAERFERMRPAPPRRPTSRAPPTRARIPCSRSARDTRRDRPAPSAERMAISCARPLERVNVRLARFEHAIRRGQRQSRPKSSASPRRARPTMASVSGITALDSVTGSCASLVATSHLALQDIEFGASRLGRHSLAQPSDRVVVVLAHPPDVDTQRNEGIDAHGEPAALRQTNIGGSTPTTRRGRPSSVIDRPTIASTHRHSTARAASGRSNTTTSAWSRLSSAGVSVRPAAADTRRTSKSDPLVRATADLRASPAPVRLAGNTMYWAIDSNDRACSRQYSKCRSLTSNGAPCLDASRQISLRMTSRPAIAVPQGFEEDAVDNREHRRRRANRQRQRRHYGCRVEVIAAKTSKRVATIEQECAHQRLEVAYRTPVGRPRLVE